jgi:hypothetical protein
VKLLTKEIFQVIDVCPRTTSGAFWNLEFPPTVVSWNGHWFKDGRLVEGWYEGAVRGICPEGEDRATDFMISTNGWSIFSRRFAESLEKKFPSAIQFLPFVYGPSSGSFERRTHCIGQLLHVIDAIDRVNALVDNNDWSAVEKNVGHVIYPVVIKREIAIQFPIFRTKFAEIQIYARYDFRDFVAESGFSGFRFQEHGPIVTTNEEPVGPDGKSLRVNAEIKSIYSAHLAQNEIQSEQKKWFKRITNYMRRHLGTESKLVTHSIVPFSFGGGLDLYYFPNDNGFAVATKDLSSTVDGGPSNCVFDRYELVMFSQTAFEPEQFNSDQTPFGSAMVLINATLEQVGQHALRTEMNPGDTLAFPVNTPVLGGKFFIVDALTPRSKSDGFGLMVVSEIGKKDFEFCQEKSGLAYLQSQSANQKEKQKGGRNRF